VLLNRCTDKRKPPARRGDLVGNDLGRRSRRALISARTAWLASHAPRCITLRVHGMVSLRLPARGSGTFFREVAHGTAARRDAARRGEPATPREHYREHYLS